MSEARVGWLPGEAAEREGQASAVEPARLRARFDEIEPQLCRFPAIDPADFRRALEEAVG